ncbi:hypothetical protein EJ02DRAFT_508334, partial [Clathrospora elynae]
MYSTFIIRLRGTSKRGLPSAGSDLRYVAFMEYAAGGNLGSISNHFRDEQRDVPEPFLWVLFRNLLRALSTMEQCHL